MRKIELIIAFILFIIPAGNTNAQSYNPNVPGVVINHSAASAEKYIGSPSIVIMPNGEYIASHDYFGPGGNRDRWNTTQVYRSSDKGKTWAHIATIENQWWSTLFCFHNALYIIGTYGRMNNAVIRKSEDGGKTWTNPTDSDTGLILEGRYHCAPVPVVIHQGRLWRAMEHAPQNRDFESFMMSVPIDKDFLKAENWTISNKIPYNENWYDGKMHSWLEGNAVVTPDNKIVNVLRSEFKDQTHSKAAIVNISPDGKQADFDPHEGFIDLPGGAKKFTIRYDAETKKYWSLVNWIQPMYLQYLGDEIQANHIRNSLALTSSEDLHDWMIERMILYHPSARNHAFQYVDWQFEGKDIIAVSRTAFDDGLGGATNYHDANFMTFHRIRNFRNNFNFDPPW